jgi:hypothetical protein
LEVLFTFVHYQAAGQRAEQTVPFGFRPQSDFPLPLLSNF